MAYEKQTWVNGDIITAEKLNHIESGISAIDDSIFYVHFLFDEDNNGNYSFSTDATFDEVYEAYENGKKIIGFATYQNTNHEVMGFRMTQYVHPSKGGPQGPIYEFAFVFNSFDFAPSQPTGTAYCQEIQLYLTNNNGASTIRSFSNLYSWEINHTNLSR